MDYDYDQEVPTFLFSSRFAMSVLGFLGFLSMNSQRVSMDVAMPCMLNTSALEVDVMAGTARDVNSTSYPPEAKCVTHMMFQQLWNASLQTTSQEGEFVWSENKQRVIFDTFSWGYLLIQLPAGWLAERFGGKKILGLFMLAASAATMLIPLASRLHYFIMVTLRFVEGAGAGVAYPAMHSFLGKWAPPMERSKMASIIYSGALIGTVLTLELAGLLCQYGFEGGWPSIFYVLGGSGLIWVILWMLFASETPLTHGRMNKEEKRYLINSLTPQTSLTRQRGMAIPCVHVITSLPFLGIVVAHFAFHWTMHIFEYGVPDYMRNVLFFDIRQSTFFYRLPSLGLWSLILISGFWADKLRGKALLTTQTTRRLMQMMGTIIPAASIAVFGFLNCSHWKIAMSLLVTGQSLVGFQYSGFFVNHLDVAPAFAGALMGTSTAVGLMAGFAAPNLIRLIITENTHEQWQTIFFISTCVALFGSFVFFFTGSGEIQKWAIPENSILRDEENADGTLYNQTGQPLQEKSRLMANNHIKSNDIIMTTLERPIAKKVRPNSVIEKTSQGSQPKNQTGTLPLKGSSKPTQGLPTSRSDPGKLAVPAVSTGTRALSVGNTGTLPKDTTASSSEQGTSSRTPSVKTKSSRTSRTSSVVIDTDADDLYSSLSESVV